MDLLGRDAPFQLQKDVRDRPRLKIPSRFFATRAERLPQVDDAQTFREAIEKGIQQVPVAGPITAFVASRFWAPSGSRRLEEWLREFADDFDRHCKDCITLRTSVDCVLCDWRRTT